MPQISFLSNLQQGDCQYAFYFSTPNNQPIFSANQERFLSASIIKVPILLAWLELERAGQVSREEICDLDVEPQVQGAGFSWLLYTRRLPYQDVLLMMIALSDNLCTNLVIRRAGLEPLNRVFRDALGLKGTELQRKLMDFAARERGLDNWVTAQDCIRLYTIRERLPARERDWVDSMLEVNQDDALLKRCIPRDTVTFWHKTGSMTGILHDWGFTERCRIFLLTQRPAGNMPAAVKTAAAEDDAVFEVFGEAGKLMLPEDDRRAE